ncbi:MAG: hypothetical protein RL101_330 [Actinomycetota bacterium]|jgi:hypothetical protein
MSIARLSTSAKPLVRVSSISKVAGVARNRKHGVAIARTVIIGFVVIQVLKLVLDIALSQSAYELRNLKLEKIELTTQSQIIGQQVDSLSSQQNLANSAQSLGMIANANPVFLRIADQKVFGKPKSALNTDGRVAKNNIASAALIQESVLTPAAPDTAISQDVAKPVAASQPVALPANAIPASPTH